VRRWHSSQKGKARTVSSASWGSQWSGLGKTLEAKIWRKTRRYGGSPSAAGKARGPKEENFARARRKDRRSVRRGGRTPRARERKNRIAARGARHQRGEKNCLPEVYDHVVHGAWKNERWGTRGNPESTKSRPVGILRRATGKRFEGSRGRKIRTSQLRRRRSKKLTYLARVQGARLNVNSCLESQTFRAYKAQEIRGEDSNSLTLTLKSREGTKMRVSQDHRGSTCSKEKKITRKKAPAMRTPQKKKSTGSLSS